MRNPRLVVIGLLTAGVLCSTVNLRAPYEQDQGAKAAKILHMVRSGQYLQPLHQPRFYREDLFPLYYVLSSLFCACVPARVFGAMNLFSVVCGVVFMVSTVYAVQRAYAVPFWLSWAVFMSMPLLLISFSYGNEAVAAMALFALGLALAGVPHRWGTVASGAAAAAAAFCRPDALLLAPFWLSWIALHAAASGTPRQVAMEVVKAGVSFALAAGFLWLGFLRTIPQMDATFPYATNPQILTAYLTYPFCPSIVLLAMAGFVFCAGKCRRVLVVLLCLLPLVFYVRNLSSPKYVIGLSLLYGVPAAVLLHRMAWWGKGVGLAGIAFWWLVSLSPYGIHGPATGAYWTVPTADGPLPTGAYLAFCRLAATGFFQEQYTDEITSQKQATEFILDGNGHDAILFGYFNPQFLYHALVERGEGEQALRFPSLVTREPAPEGRRLVMVRYGFLRTDYMDPRLCGQVRHWLDEGRVRAIEDSRTPVPPALEIGDSIPEASDQELAGRILFLQNYYAGQGCFDSRWSPPAYKPLFWTSAEHLPPTGIHPVYQDSHFRCYDRPVKGAMIWRTRMPFVYYSSRNPNVVMDAGARPGE